MHSLKKNTKCFAGGESAKLGKGKCYIPDVYSKGSKLIEFKTSFGAARKDQFQEFINLSMNNFGTKMSMVFYKKPTQAEMKLMQKWAVEAAEKSGKASDDMIFNIIHILD